LQPDREWQVDTAHMESLVDANTAAIVVNNPSNPCGCVYSAEHLSEILAVAEVCCCELFHTFLFD
jgi:tyrosine aminotransferase